MSSVFYVDLVKYGVGFAAVGLHRFVDYLSRLIDEPIIGVMIDDVRHYLVVNLLSAFCRCQRFAVVRLSDHGGCDFLLGLMFDDRVIIIDDGRSNQLSRNQYYVLSCCAMTT